MIRRSPSLSALDQLKKRHDDEVQNYKLGEMPK